MCEQTPELRSEPGSHAGLSAQLPPRRWHLLLAAACIGAIYFGGVTGRWWPTPDSALYLGLARSLASGEGYRFNGQVCNSVTPGLPMILAGLRRAFGQGCWAPNLFMAVCGVGALALIYWGINRLSDRLTALMVTLCCAFSYTFFFNCHRILTDAPGTVLFWATFCVCLRASRGRLWWLPAVAVLTAATVTVRAPAVLMLAPLAIGLLVQRPEKGRRGRHLLLAGVLLGTMLAVLALLYMLARHGAGDMPLYVRLVSRLRPLSPWTIGQRVGRGILELPHAMVEMFTSQDTFVVVAAPALVCMVIGGVSLWRRGQRVPFIVVALYVCGLSAVGAARGVRPRYLLPAQPLFAYLTIQGLVCTVAALRRWRGKQPSPSLYRKTAMAFTAVVVIANGPRLLRNAVYYSYLSYTPRYYQVIRSGRYAELVELSEIIRRDFPRTARVGLVGKQAGMLHYLADRRIVSLRGVRQRTDDDAGAVLKAADSDPGLGVLVIDVSDSSGAFVDSLTSALAAKAGFQRVYRGTRYIAYGRLLGTSPAGRGTRAHQENARGNSRGGLPPRRLRWLDLRAKDRAAFQGVDVHAPA